MVAPPGLIFIYRLAFPQIIVLITTYGALASVEGRLPDFSSLSTWIYLICAFFARPLLILVNSWYTERSDDRKAVELGAVQPPAVVGSSNELRSAIMRSFSHGYTGDCFFEWTKRYGYTYRMKIYGEKRIMTIEPEHIKAILATQFDNFEKGPVVFEQFHSLLGLGVFNSDGDRWKTHRNMTRPFFNRNRISDFDNFERHAEDTIAMIKARLAEGYPVDFQDVVARFTLDSATEFLFGKDVESLCNGSSPLR